MRLLNTRTLQFEEFLDKRPKYAILSHRWEDEKITYKHVERGQQENVPGWSKVRDCCRLARTRHIPYVWVDTCCIDKTSSSELSEAINSMYQWYEEARECYVYLSDVKAPNLSSQEYQDQFSKSVWFTRGWTLQELIAPKTVLFWNKHWKYLGSKDALYSYIEDITGIDADVLSGKLKPSQCTVSQRMSWAARRFTTRPEDRAYCLIGLFNVNMPMLYGEGEKAFRRLQKEIMESSDDHTIFAWQSENFAKPVLAHSPSCFLGLEHMTQLLPFNDTTQGFALSNAGLSIELYLIPWAMNTYLAPLRCGYPKVSSEGARNSVRGYSRACLFLQQTSHENQFVRVAVDGEDLKIMDGDHVAQIRDDFQIPQRMVMLKQPNDPSNIAADGPSFYGFEFVFKHKNAFSTGCAPSPADALCYHKWKLEEPVFEVENGGLHAAGLFRLSGFHNGLYMYFGFDYDFAPICLITSNTPKSSKTRRFSMLPPDFTTISKDEAVRLLDLNWLRSQIKEASAGRETILTFKGHRSDRIEIECYSLSLVLTFEKKKSKGLKLDAWHVTIDQLRQPDSRLQAEDVKVKRSNIKSYEIYLGDKSYRRGGHHEERQPTLFTTTQDGDVVYRAPRRISSRAAKGFA